MPAASAGWEAHMLTILQVLGQQNGPVLRTGWSDPGFFLLVAALVAVLVVTVYLIATTAVREPHDGDGSGGSYSPGDKV